MNNTDDKGFYILNDSMSREPLYGNMGDFRKDSPEEKLQSNHIGADCLTRPSLCDEGFTIKFDVKGRCFGLKLIIKLMLISEWERKREKDTIMQHFETRKIIF